ncbi:terpenoid synthase [Agrocybe pediades]|nr:terpenoid synthase [Agrocybe pediades]
MQAEQSNQNPSLPRASAASANQAVPEAYRYPDYVISTLNRFIEQLDYVSEALVKADDRVLQEIRHEFLEFDNGAWFDATCSVSANLAVLPYPMHSHESKLMVARFTWFLLYVDDIGKRDRGTLEGLQKALVGSTTDEGFAQRFRGHMLDWYKHWDPLPANCINLAGLDMINGWLLEETQSVQEMNLMPAGQSFANYLRTKTGGGSCFAFMLFPKEFDIDISVYIQVMDDLTLFNNYANDIFSFYKEELQGETNNYMHNRAFLTGKHVAITFQEIFDETVAAYERITSLLENTKAAPIWKRFVNGYLAFHLNVPRYRLREIGLKIRGLDNDF